MKRTKQILSVFLSVCMVLTCMVGMSVTASAVDNTAAEVLKPTVTNGKVTDAKVLEYAGKQWYVIASNGVGVPIAAGAVTSQTEETTLVLLAKENWDTSIFASMYNNNYVRSDLKTQIDGLVNSAKIGTYYTSEDETWKNGLVATRTLAGGASSGSNYESVDNISGSQVTNAILWPLSAYEVGQIDNSTIRQGTWWLRSPGRNHLGAACVNSGSLDSRDVMLRKFGVRPALCLNLTSNIFASEKSGEPGVYELTKAQAHTHIWGYDADGATITANCSGEGTCDITPAPTLTISAANKEYDDTPAEAVITTSDNWNPGNGLPEWQAVQIQYYSVETAGTTTGGTSLGTSAPSDAGHYYAAITIGEKTAVAAFSIGSLTMTVMEKTINNIYDMGAKDALENAVIDLDVDKIKAEIGAISGIGEKRLEQIMEIIQRNIKEADDKENT